MFKTTTLALLTLLMLGAMSRAGAQSISLQASISSQQTAPVLPGQQFSVTINYSWSNADYGTHALKVDVTLPPSLIFVSTTPSGGSFSNGIARYAHPVFTVPQDGNPFTQDPKGQGSGTVTVNVRVAPNPTTPQACVSATVSENAASAPAGNRCFDVHCECTGVISAANLAGNSAKSLVVYDMGTVTTVPCGNTQLCSLAVASKVAQILSTQRQMLEGSACNINVQPGTTINAFAMLGTQSSYFLAKTVGVLSNATVTTCTCPPGWVSNTSGVDGGVTTDGKCKKQVATMNISPLPPNTTISTWGFTVGNALFVWGTATNGGAPNCVTVPVTPRVCKIQ